MATPLTAYMENNGTEGIKGILAIFDAVNLVCAENT